VSERPGRRSAPIRFVVTLAAIPGGDVEPIVRLRLALKVLRRAFKLRCLRVVEETE
jgi:hypothetical protein